MPHLHEVTGRWTPTPEFKRSVDQIRYWADEKLKWTEGYLGMNGLQYFHLTMGAIIDINGGKIKPMWRDVDAWMSDAYVECMRDKKNLLVMKPRGIGLTTLFGGTVPMWHALTEPGIEVLLTSSNEAKLKDLISRKLQPVVNAALREGIIPKDYYDNPDNIDFTSKKNKSEVGSKIVFIETNKDDKSPAKVEAYRTVYIFLDEYFLHERAEMVLRSARASMEQSSEKKGIMVLGGSCNSMNIHSIPRLRATLDKAKSLNIYSIFIPGTYGMVQAMDENGFSMLDKAREIILKKRLQLQEDKAFDELENYTKDTPIEESDLLNSASLNPLSSEVARNVQKSRMLSFVQEENSLICELTRRYSEVLTKRNEAGYIHIYEQPQQGHIYICGIDPIQGNIESEEGSEFFAWIKDITTRQYVAYLAIRDKDAEIMYEEWHKLVYFYKSDKYPKGALTLVENNAGSTFIEKCRHHQTLDLLARDPKVKSTSGWAKGYRKTKLNAPILDAGMKLYLKYNTLPSARFLLDLDLYLQNRNADSVDAMQATEYLSSFLSNLDPEDAPKRTSARYTKGADGAVRLVWETEEPEDPRHRL